MDGKTTGRLERLETILRTAHARRETPPPDPGLISSVLGAIKTRVEPAANGILWRMAAGAGLLAVATVVLTLALGSGFEDEFGRFLFYDPNGQVLVSLLGV
jgi:hypothetical protein